MVVDAARQAVDAPGYVDTATASKITGWIKSEFLASPITVFVNGTAIATTPSFHPRADLMAEGVDGIGFTIYYYSFSTTFDLEVAVTGGGKRFKLVFADSEQTIIGISDISLELAVLSASELSTMVSSLRADSVAFLEATQKYGSILAKSGFAFDVHFIDGTFGSVSTRYRILNVADGLLESGYRCLLSQLTEGTLHDIVNTNARVVVFFRAPLNDLFQWALTALRDKGVRIVYDVDDLVFDESIIHEVDGVRFLSHEETDLYIEGVRLYRKFAEAADLLTVSTPYLADHAQKILGRGASVVRNTIGKNYLEEFAKKEQSPTRESDGKFVVGYYSGSKTHQADFHAVYTAIVALLDRRPDTYFRVAGHFDLDEFPRMKEFRDRIVKVPFMHYWEMIEDLANCDIIIAPLVTNDPFCEAKSELKFFEAALRMRPCIASPTRTYLEADDGRGLLKFANSEQEWTSAFDFFHDSENRADYAKRAFEFAIKKYSYQEAGRDAEKAYFGFTRRRRTRSASPPEKTEISTPRSIGVVVPEIFIGGGGHRKIFRFCKDLADAGMSLTIYVDTQRNPAIVYQEIKRYFYSFQADVRAFRIVDPNHDVLICTHWSTVYNVRNQKITGKKFYFNQDFEPMFEPVNSQYVKALSTYGMGFQVVCFGNWIANKVEADFSTPVKRIPFTLDHSIYNYEALPKTVDILLFARPSQPRRCFELAVEALRIVYKQNRSVRIGLYGEESYGDLGFKYHNFGLIKNQSTLADLYRNSRVGICFSPTNPSLVGYEMIACGLPVIDIKVPGWEVNFGGEDIVYYAQPVPEEISERIMDALGGDSEYQERVARGVQYSKAMPSDDAIGHSMLKFVTE